MPSTLSLYRRARRLGIEIPLSDLWSMLFRKVRPALVLEAAIVACEAGVPFSLEQAETHFLCGCDPRRVARAAAARASRGEAPLIANLTACELAGMDAELLVADRIDVSRLPGGFDPGPKYRRLFADSGGCP